MATNSAPSVDPDRTEKNPYMTKAGIRKTYCVSNREIYALEREGYLHRIVLNRKVKCYWRSDVEAGVQAYLRGHTAPAPTYKHPAPINWEV